MKKRGAAKALPSFNYLSTGSREISMAETFILTEQHIQLLRNARWRWENCEFGAPAIDCKRPYGNSSVYDDMCGILGIDIGSADYANLRRLHEELELALEVIFQFQTFATGHFTRPNAWSRWERA